MEVIKIEKKETEYTLKFTQDELAIIVAGVGCQNAEMARGRLKDEFNYKLPEGASSTSLYRGLLKASGLED